VRGGVMENVLIVAVALFTREAGSLCKQSVVILWLEGSMIAQYHFAPLTMTLK